MNSIIGWVGGKRLLRKVIVPLIPKHNTYCEPFGGAAWILFGKSEDHKVWQVSKKHKYREVLNDINGELINFWRHVKYHPDAFKTEVEQFMASRELFTEFLNMKPRTDFERAMVFYYKLACSFGSLSKTFAVRGHRSMLPIRNGDKLQQAADRLKDVVIEKLSFDAVINKYDNPRSFFYIDPPYYEHENLYERDLADCFDEHEELNQLLKSIKGKWLLSYNDHPYIRKLYKDFLIENVETLYSLSGASKPKTEIIIRNY
jgi:DNA adenine methylase